METRPITGQDMNQQEFTEAALYGEPSSATIKAKAKAGKAGSERMDNEPEIPDFDDRTWNGPYDDDE